MTSSASRELAAAPALGIPATVPVPENATLMYVPPFSVLDLEGDVIDAEATLNVAIESCRSLRALLNAKSPDAKSPIKPLRGLMDPATLPEVPEAEAKWFEKTLAAAKAGNKAARHLSEAFRRITGESEPLQVPTISRPMEDTRSDRGRSSLRKIQRSFERVTTNELTPQFSSGASPNFNLHDAAQLAELEMSSQETDKGSPNRGCMSKWSRYNLQKEAMLTAIWEQASQDYSQSMDIDFFEDIVIAGDGGLSEVGELWDNSRWVMAVLVVLLILSNVGTLVYNDLTHCRKATFHWYRVSEEHRQDLDPHHDHFLLSRYIVEHIVNLIASHWGWQACFGSSAIAVACILELGLLFALACRAIYVSIRCHPASRMRWFMVAEGCWKVLPEICTFSAMRLLHFLTPTVISADIYKFYTYSTSRWYCERHGLCQMLVARKWAKFLLTRSICLIVGFDAFLVKVHQARSYIDQPVLTWWSMLNIVLFMIQVLGIVQLQIFVRNRIYLFIFGGEDSVLQLHERVMMDVWEAMLAKAIFEEHSFPRAMAIMLSFDDADFQKLVLNSRPYTETVSPRTRPGTKHPTYSGDNPGVPNFEDSSIMETHITERPRAFGDSAQDMENGEASWRPLLAPRSTFEREEEMAQGKTQSGQSSGSCGSMTSASASSTSVGSSKSFSLFQNLRLNRLAWWS